MSKPKIKITQDVVNHNDKYITKIGRLIFCWANDETLFQIIFAILAGVTNDTAMVLWFTRKNTRDRVDFTVRIAQVELSDKKLLGRIEKAAKEYLGAPTKLRNHYAHAYYRQDEDFKILSAECFETPIGEDAKPLVRKVKKFDHIRYNELNQTLNKLEAINFELWRIIGELQKSYGVRKTELPAWLRER